MEEEGGSHGFVFGYMWGKWSTFVNATIKMILFLSVVRLTALANLNNLMI